MIRYLSVREGPDPEHLTTTVFASTDQKLIGDVVNALARRLGVGTLTRLAEARREAPLTDDGRRE